VSSGVSFPLYVFEKDDWSMERVESPDRVLYQMEPIDIENDEYLFWDAKGRSVGFQSNATRWPGLRMAMLK